MMDDEVDDAVWRHPSGCDGRILFQWQSSLALALPCQTLYLPQILRLFHLEKEDWFQGTLT